MHFHSNGMKIKVSLGQALATVHRTGTRFVKEFFAHSKFLHKFYLGGKNLHRKNEHTNGAALLRHHFVLLELLDVGYAKLFLFCLFF